MREIPGSASAATPFHPQANLKWLSLHEEQVIDPGLEIVDAHHHLFDRAQWRYGVDEFRADLGAGHRVIETVYVECREAYRADGPEALKPVGETESVERIASAHTRGPVGTTRIAAAIVAHADLSLGAEVDRALDAHAAASPGRFRGIRHSAADDPDPAFVRSGPRPARARLDAPEFRAGFARLAARGLVFDAWVYHPQLPEVLSLARAFPQASIVLDHVGGPLGIGRYALGRDEHFSDWQRSIRALAAAPNVSVKLGGLGMRFCGFGFHGAPRPPDSETLARAWRPHIETCIEAFGPRRCMFESNFPVDQLSCSYRTLWNAFKRIAAGCSAEEKADLFSGTARRAYGITGVAVRTASGRAPG